MLGLSSSLENVFRDDVRNGICHADYILWGDGLRLRRRNGGFATRIEYSEIPNVVSIGLAFFETFRALGNDAIRSFDPPREIIGRFSANLPMAHTVGFNPETRSFSISCSSVGRGTSPEYLVQEAINQHLGGSVLVVFRANEGTASPNIDIHACGLEPAEVDMPQDRLNELLQEIESRGLWDERAPAVRSEGLLILSPWGFRYLFELSGSENMIGEPDI